MSTAVAQVIHDAPAKTESMAMMEMISRAAADPSTDIEKMERMYRMKVEFDSREAAKAYANAMAEAQAEMPAIVKNKTNTQTNSRYANLEVVNEAITPIYTKHGFSLSYSTEEPKAEGWVRVRCLVSHRGGHSEVFCYDNPVDDKGLAGKQNKTDTHGRSSAVSYSRRYLAMMIFNLTIKDEDNDGNGGGAVVTISEEQQAKIAEWIEQSGADKDKFLALYGVDKISELPVKRYNEALRGLQQKARVNGGAK